MGRKQARIGDPSSHGGVIVTGADAYQWEESGSPGRPARVPGPWARRAPDCDRQSEHLYRRSGRGARRRQGRLRRGNRQRQSRYGRELMGDEAKS